MKTSKNTIIAICTIVAIVLLITATTLASIKAANEREELRFLYENANTKGIVVEKHTSEYRGTYFHITAEHESQTMSGERTTFTREYTIPWEEYIQIEIGDTIIAYYDNGYHPNTVSGGWKYVSSVK